MTKVFIIDNHQEPIKGLFNLIKLIYQDAEIRYSENVNNILDSLSNNDNTILFLDSDLCQQQEQQLAQRIEDMENKPLIFILSNYRSKKHITQMVNLNASGYLIKPIQNFQKATNINNQWIMISTPTGVCPIKVGSILAIERMQRNSLTIYTKEETYKGVRGKLSQLSEFLSNDHKYISRKCIINYKMITHIAIKDKEITLKNDKKEKICVKCSKSKFKDIIQWFRIEAKHLPA